MKNISPVELEKYLKGMDYPTNKKGLIECAKRNGADKEICDSLNRLPEQQFERPTDVVKAMTTHSQSSQTR